MQTARSAETHRGLADPHALRAAGHCLRAGCAAGASPAPIRPRAAPGARRTPAPAGWPSAHAGSGAAACPGRDAATTEGCRSPVPFPASRGAVRAGRGRALCSSYAQSRSAGVAGRKLQANASSGDTGRVSRPPSLPATSRPSGAFGFASCRARRQAAGEADQLFSCTLRRHHATPNGVRDSADPRVRGSATGRTRASTRTSSTSPIVRARPTGSRNGRCAWIS